MEEKVVLFIASAKIPVRERSISHLAFMGNCPSISHTFLALSTQWVSSPPSRKYRRGVSPRFHLIVLCLSKEN